LIYKYNELYVRDEIIIIIYFIKIEQNNIISKTWIKFFIFSKRQKLYLNKLCEKRELWNNLCNYISKKNDFATHIGWYIFNNDIDIVIGHKNIKNTNVFIWSIVDNFCAHFLLI